MKINRGWIEYRWTHLILWVMLCLGWSGLLANGFGEKVKIELSGPATASINQQRSLEIELRIRNDSLGEITLTERSWILVPKDKSLPIIATNSSLAEPGIKKRIAIRSKGEKKIVVDIAVLKWGKIVSSSMPDNNLWLAVEPIEYELYLDMLLGDQLVTSEPMRISFSRQ